MWVSGVCGSGLGIWRAALIFRFCAVSILVVAAAMLAAAAAGASEMVERQDLLAVFDDHGVTGAFVAYDVAADRAVAVDPDRAARRLIPASTFKVANSLIALETGVIADADEIVPYGGKPQPIKAWEADMSIRQAIRVSNVPVYQELARRIGLPRYRAWLDRLGYGNADPGDQVDVFWLRGPLAISAVEQTRFLARLARRDLPASDRSQGLVRDILRIEQGDGYVLYAKTGWSIASTPQLGWWVGWVERGDALHTFALNIDMHANTDARKRITLGRALLAKLDLL